MARRRPGATGGLFSRLLLASLNGTGMDAFSRLRLAGPVLFAGECGLLVAVTQAPLTSFIILMEMVDGHAMVLSLMACALVAKEIARCISPPLYPGLAALQLPRISTKA